MVHVDESLERVNALLGLSRTRTTASSSSGEVRKQSSSHHDVSGMRDDDSGAALPVGDFFGKGKLTTTYDKIQASFAKQDVFSWGSYDDLFHQVPEVSDSDVSRDMGAFLHALVTEASDHPDKYTYQDPATGTRRMYASVDTVTRAKPQVMVHGDDFVHLTLAKGAMEQVQKRLHEHNQTVEMYEKAPLEYRVSFALAAMYEHDNDPRDEDEINQQARRLVTTVASLKDASNFFGQPDSQPVGMFDFGSNHSQMDLLRAWNGPNKYMTNYVIQTLSTDRSWALYYGLPLQRDDNIAGMEAEFIVFNNASLDRSPLMSTGSAVSYRTARYASIPVRFGKTMEMEWNFYQTPRGRFMWGMHQQQIMNGTVTTLSQGANVAMIVCKGTIGDAEHNYDVDIGVSTVTKKRTVFQTRDAVEMAVRDECMTWDRIHSVLEPLNKVMDDACRQINEQTSDYSGGENVTVDKSRMVMAVGSGVPTLSREVGIANDPIKTGKARPEIFGYFGSEQDPDETKVMPGGWRLAESRKYRAQNGASLEPQRHTRVIGHAAYSTGGHEWLDEARSNAPLVGGAAAPINGGNANGGAGAALAQAIDAAGTSASSYKTTYSDIWVWTAASDKLQRVRFQTLLEHNCMYETPDDRSQSVNGGKRPITRLGMMALLHKDRQNNTLMDADGHPGYYATYIDPVKKPSHYKNAVRRVIAARDVNDNLRRNGGTPWLANFVMSAAQFLGKRVNAFARVMLVRARSNANFQTQLRQLTPAPPAVASAAVAAAAAAAATASGAGHAAVSAAAAAAVAAMPALANVTINSENDAVTALHLISMIDSGFLDFALAHDLPTGMHHEDAAPSAQYVAKATIIWRNGSTGAWNMNGIVSGIGRTQYALPSYMVSLDAQTRYYSANFHIWAKSSVMQPAFLYIDKTTYIERYLGGHGGQLWTTQDHKMMFDSRNAKTAYQHCIDTWKSRPEMVNKSSYSLFMPPDAAPMLDQFYDITGEYSTDLLSETQELHYPTALFYRDWWNFMVVNSVNRQDISHSSTYGNSIMCRQLHEGMLLGGQREVRGDKGHWGASLYPSYLTNRKYPGTKPPPLDPKAKYT